MTDSNVAVFTQNSRSEYEKHLRNLVKMPSVSSDPARKADVLRCAKYAGDLLRSIGMTVQMISPSNQSHPIVFGQYTKDRLFPTILIYNHLDVQPADPEEWKFPPFEFTASIEGKYFGRGATDDKGPALAGLFAVKYAIANDIPLNFQVVFECEEEIGSHSFEGFFDIYNKFDIPKPNSILISDGLWISKDKPSLEYGLRGNVGFTMSLETGAKDVHSGVCGGLARNPIAELCEVISQCHDAETGFIKIPGFYDRVQRTKRDEVSMLLGVGFSQREFQEVNELYSLRNKNDAEAICAIKTMPTFEITGLHGGYDGPGVKTIVPHCAEAKIAIRIVANQTTDEVFSLVSGFIHGLNPDIRITSEKQLETYYVDPSGPHVTALRNAVSSTLDKELLLDRSGGSIGAAKIMSDQLNVPIIFFGLSLPEHGYHARNEFFEWKQAEIGIKVFSEYFKEIAKIKS